MASNISGEILDLLTTLRRNLHRNAELSGQERDTAALVREFIRQHSPCAETVTGLGGSGLAFCYPGRSAGPTVMFRAELDALPISETSALPHHSRTPGVAHKCGHDGHMAILAGLGVLLHRQPPRRGRAVLLFQPAEETGAGALQIINDPKFARLSPDLIFALHNVPGHPAGGILVKEGTITCASVGMLIGLSGKSAHASHPEQGLSPAAAMCEIMRRFPLLPQNSAMKGFGLVTLVHACLGEEAVGTAPGEARVLATLRAETNEDLERLKERAAETAGACARAERLGWTVEWKEYFAAGINDTGAVDAIALAAVQSGLRLDWLAKPFRWSEDFGQFSSKISGAMFALGAGEQTAPLHSPDYDFPEKLIAPGLKVFWNIVDRLLNADGPSGRHGA
ncbi:MAG: amidohydrolase [Desulfobacterales bacterium]